MVERIEVRLRDTIATFDGTVFELFDIGLAGSARHHVALIGSLEIRDSSLWLTCQDTSIMSWPFDDGRRARVEQLVAAVTAARP